jgi:hypothetical protein
LDFDLVLRQFCFFLFFDKNLFIFFKSLFRCLTAQAQAKPVESKQETPAKKEKTVKHNQSFVHNLYRGQVEHSQLVPFPIGINEEQIETLGQLVRNKIKVIIIKDNNYINNYQ